MIDLANQKRDILISFSQYFNYDLNNNYTIPDSKNLNDFIKIISDMTEHFDSIRDGITLTKTSFYLFINIVYSLFGIAVLLITIQKYTIADMFYCFKKKRNTFFVVSNRNSLFVSIMTIICYNVISIIAYIMIYRYLGYNTWDSTVIHTIMKAPLYALIVLGPSTITIFLVTKVTQYQYIYVKEHKRGCCTKLFHLFKYNKKYNNLSEIYMTRIYTLFLAMLELYIVISFQGTFTLFFPILNPIITPYNWELRFQLLTVQIILLPLLISVIYSINITERSKGIDNINETANFKYSGLDSNDNINLLSEQGDY